MRFNEEKKQAIKHYLLEKIEQGSQEVTKTVADAFSVNQNTIYTYVNELVEQGIIRRIKRGEYVLNSVEYTYELSRCAGDLNSDTYAYEKYLHQHISQLERNVKEIWSYAFTEMINNVMDHSLAENVRLVIRQNYANTTVMILDNGVGIFKKLMEYFSFPSLDEAICELFKGKLTTDSKNHSGEGIFFSSRMMDDFYIISSGKIFTHNKYDNSNILDMANENLIGTGVIMTLSNFTHKSSRDVFDLYANVDGGFTKTRIPLKNIFDSSPVSRSQAKRVCNRLEKFKEIILDFDDISWMGQGFAHQLFVVFQNENPDVKMVPVNMNEDVTKMYQHVKVTM